MIVMIPGVQGGHVRGWAFGFAAIFSNLHAAPAITLRIASSALDWSRAHFFSKSFYTSTEPLTAHAVLLIPYAFDRSSRWPLGTRCYRFITGPAEKTIQSPLGAADCGLHAIIAHHQSTPGTPSHLTESLAAGADKQSWYSSKAPPRFAIDHYRISSLLHLALRHGHPWFLVSGTCNSYIRRCIFLQPSITARRAWDPSTFKRTSAQVPSLYR
jgi:hypothetical protein